VDANQIEGGAPAQSPKIKQKAKKRRHVSTVTKNPDTLNARLDTHPLVDPFFAKLNSMVGDINSSKRLMQNIIPTKESNLKLRQNILIWDKSEIAMDEEQISTSYQDLAIVTSVTIRMHDLVLRTGLKNYRICDLPMENADEADTSMRYQNDEVNQTLIGRNASNVDLQFDINAEVEPISNEKSFIMDFGDMNEQDFDDVAEDQRDALNRCRGLKRQPILIEDMQPETSAALSDYSYRPLDTIDQFWAGPSHWKFRYSRRTHLSGSIGSRSSLPVASTSCVSEVQAVQQRPKATRKKKIIKRADVSLEEALNADDFDTLYVQKGKSKSTQITVQIMAKRWDSKKLKLPMDHRIPSDIFDTFSHSTAISINTNHDATFTGTDNDDNNTYNYDNELDRNYCSRLEVQSDTETETNTDMGQMDNNVEFDMNEMLPPPPIQQLDEIPDIFVGAPDRIEKISIAFAKRAKVVDMKQLKQCSFNIIVHRNNTNPLQHPCFSEILRDLPKTLNKAMAESMSMPLAFYAILHLCNDKGLLLTPNENLEDFEISFV
jgi:condensin complex subunit 2